HHVVGAHALGQPETAAGARHRVVDVLAQDDAAVLELDLQGRTLGQSQRVAHRLGQGDLAAFGNGGFHGRPPGARRYAPIIHTFLSIPLPPYWTNTGRRRGSVTEAERVSRTLPCRTPEPTHCSHRRFPWPIHSPPTTLSRSTARPTPTPACRSSANDSTSPACRSR